MKILKIKEIMVSGFEVSKFQIFKVSWLEVKVSRFLGFRV
jgi:hypothetical protein